MKRLFTIMTTVLLTATLWAQNPPQRMSYQAVIRDGTGLLVTSTQIGMEINIRQGSVSGTIVYTETQTPTTNANGLVSIEIGGGAGFSTINWGANSYFIETKIAVVEPLTTYTISGISQLLSVPYALYAKATESISGTIPASQVSDFQTSVTNNAEVLLNTAKATNATHTGDVTGSEALTLATVNSDVGTFNNITINTKGLATAGSNVSYLTLETDPTVKALNGIIKSNGTTISAATAGTDYLTPTGSAELLTDFPLLNQPTTGSAASFTGNLVGEVTGTQDATIVENSAVIGKILTNYVSGAGTITASDNILQAIQKLNGNDATNANLTGMVTSNGNETTVVTNANLTGDVISTGNATTITNKITMTATAPVSITGSPTVIASGAVAISIAAATPSEAGSMSASDKTKLDGLQNADGSETKVFSGTNISVTGSGTSLSPYIVNANSSGWSLTGNSGTVDGTNFIGTTDDKPFDFRVNNQTRLFLSNESNPNGSYGKVGINTKTPAQLFHIKDAEIPDNGLDDDLDYYADETDDQLVFTNDGRLGIKTTSPSATLDVRGNIKIFDGTQGVGKVLTSDANGVAAWQDAGGSGSTHAIGDSYGGGIVFYVYDGGQHGLIAATADQSTSMRWYAGTYTNTMAKADGAGVGKANTAIIIANQGYGDGATYAARICNEYSVTDGGVKYGDWYLPSKFELYLLYVQQAVVGGFAVIGYWSSTEDNSNGAWYRDFGDGYQDCFSKDGTKYVRAIRAF